MRVYEGVVDRTDWSAGPWDGEPDKVQWVDEASDLDCLAVRHPSAGSWCGYVGVPPGHPLHGKCWEDLDLVGHAGVNFSAPCEEGRWNEARGICHVPEPGRAEDVWWFGFDCEHSRDLAPGSYARMRAMDQLLGENLADLLAPGLTYRTLDYVKQEVARLAQQLVAAGRGEESPGGLRVGGVVLTAEQVRELLGSNVNPMMLMEAMASVALDRAPAGQTRVVDEVDGGDASHA